MGTPEVRLTPRNLPLRRRTLIATLFAASATVFPPLNSSSEFASRVFVAQAFAQDAPPQPSLQSVEERLRTVKSQIDAAAKTLRETRKNQGDLENQLGKLDERQQKVAKDKAGIQASLEKYERAQQLIADELSKSSLRLQRLDRDFRERIVANYKMINQASGVAYLATAASATDLLRRTVYLSRISQHDERAIAELENQIREVDKQRRQLETVRVQREQQARALNEIQKGLQRTEDEKRALLDKKQAEARGQEATLKKLTRTQRELEVLLESLTGGEEKPPSVPDQTPAPDGGPPEPVPTVPPLTDRPVPFNGRGLEAVRGQLLFPVSGRLIHGFGMARHEEFSEVLFHKGVEMEAPGSTTVQSVAPGKVVIEQDLPGIGLTVIIDHGDRYYSLYGRLQVATIHTGQEVQKGQALGKVGPADQQGRNFYFEIRFKGKAINPAPFFRNLPVAASS